MHWRAPLIAALAVGLTALFATEAKAQRTANVPVQVGLGPAGNMFAGPTFDEEIGWGGRLYEDQPIHTGLRLNITAVIDADLVRAHPRLVPRQYRGQFRGGGEVRYRPGILALIPSSFYLSPPIQDASAWGATWSVIGIGLPLMREPIRPSVSGALIGSLMYIDSESVTAPYFFARPGVELQFDIEVPLADDFLISVGWASKVYAPQSLDDGLLSFGGFDDDSLWHVGQFYLKGHVRVPYPYRY